jgi:hypothetical protein
MKIINNLQGDCVACWPRITNVIHNLTVTKNEGISGLSLNFFIYASADLHMHITLLIIAMLSHCHAPARLTSLTIIPIPKGNRDKLNTSYNQ